MSAALFDDNFINWLPVGEQERLLRLTEPPQQTEGIWDWIVVSDVFARVPAYFDGADPYGQFFSCMKEHLTPGGHLVLAVDNRYGLTYFAGAKERLSGTYFEGLEGYPDAEGIRTFSKETILRMAAENGFCAAKTYYPYPDYRHTAVLYSDEKLPQAGELNRNLCNIGEERLVLFDEARAFESLIADGKFAEFANSFLFDLALEPAQGAEEIIYVKYSVERAEQYRIRTEIVKKADGMLVVRKIPCSAAAAGHVRAIKEREALLKEQCEPSDVQVNHCTLTDRGAEFEFLFGVTLEEKLDALLADKNFAALTEEIRLYAKRLEEMLSLQQFVQTEQFTEIFGQITFDTPQTAAKVNNIDWIFSNIMITADGKWNVIDYEWTFAFPVPFKFIIYRAVSLYCQGSGRECLRNPGIFRMLGITQGEEMLFAEMEHRLQLFILGDTQTFAQYYGEQAGKTIYLRELLHKAHRPEMKIYFDLGAGFSEENCRIVEAAEDFYGRRRFDIPLCAGVTAVRIDPCEEMCQLAIHRIAGECGGAYEPEYTHNGRAFENYVLYTTDDPQLVIGGIVPGSSVLHIDLTVEYVKEETAYALMKLLEKAEKCARIESSAPYRLLKKIKEIKKG